MDTDQALVLLGPYSKWQLRSYFIYAFGFGVPLAWMWMGIVFIGDTPNYRCQTAPNSTLNNSIPWICEENGMCQYDQCNMYRNLSIDNSTGSCQNGYWYDPESGYDSTLVSEFDLVCGRDGLVELSMTINAVGATVGALIFPVLSDMYGRRMVFLGCMWTNVVIATIQAFSIDMWMYTILGFIDGLQQQGMLTSAVILAIELFPTDQRTFAGVAVEFFWAFGYVTLVPIAYFVRNWRYLQLAITLPLLFTVVFYWFIFESIPWLVANNRREEAEQILQKAAKFNGVTIPSNVFTGHDFLLTGEKSNNNLNDENSPSLEVGDKLTLSIQDDQEDVKSKPKFSGFVNKMKSAVSEKEKEPETTTKYKIWDLLKSKKIMLYSVIQWFIWFVNSIGYNAIALTVTYLPGNRYLNFFLYAIIEVPAYIGMWIMLYYLGRRITICVSHIIGGLALIGMIIQLYDTDNNLTPLIITLSLAGKAGFTFSYGAIYVHTPEMYPTTVRNTAMGICQMFAKIGSLVAPLFRIITRQQPMMTPLIIGGSSVIAGLLVLFLPETRHEPLPDTILEVENFGKSNKPKY